ncbi:Uncharacterised protein (plasmid) [Tsukamurella tyrosinosolvens]|uniref:Uncharacterized protein n=1 Tax=Tsukamurella tyrosinosolvens TaxID=57704 RepID=A0A1H4VPD7_TSUTY|nr:hypothetical protein [Tsukamurella tyrosinosolvens]KXO90921.1 hypothetical protein AXK58_21035 [Tsukamurella tyrosinosolvens]SEC82897.1 hypothetical protein SAMN04489793_3294 [Tsukamurella tyrosinosolvens]VEH90385.1 Uncharacterised protein [Tsukamurella tyrosinosolvens]
MSAMETVAPATPVIDKMTAEKAEMDAVFEFLEWLDAKGIVLAHYEEDSGFRDEQLVPVPRSSRSLMFESFGIDENALDKERRAVLAHHVAMTGGENL